MDISVIVCTYNRCEQLKTALAHLVAMDIPEGLTWELLVVDNNSGDETKRVVMEAAALAPVVVQYHFEGKQGKSFALNLGIERAKGHILAFTDDDAVVDSGWLRNIARTFEQTDCAAMGGRIIATWGSLKRPTWMGADGKYPLMDCIVAFDLGDEVAPLSRPPYGANVAIRRETFTRNGGFRTDLGPTAGNEIRGEDTELFVRLEQAGERMVYSPHALVFHPVEEKRLTKAFFEAWYYSHGRAQIIQHGTPASASHILGVPRFLFRKFLTDVAKWLTATRPDRRFYYKLACHRTAGTIAEIYHASRREASVRKNQPARFDLTGN
jgi:glycosyltransferase involved in cell wall biosynthesis